MSRDEAEKQFLAEIAMEFKSQFPDLKLRRRHFAFMLRFRNAHNPSASTPVGVDKSTFNSQEDYMNVLHLSDKCFFMAITKIKDASATVAWKEDVSDEETLISRYAYN